jgi:hypothetical protein
MGEASFSAGGRTWRPRITVGRLAALRGLGIDLGAEPFAAINALALREPEQLVSAAYLLCGSDHPNVPPEEFAESVDGDALADIFAALCQAVVDFFPNPSARPQMSAALREWIQGPTDPAGTSNGTLGNSPVSPVSPTPPGTPSAS